eukprot:TRINITY_DN5259_c0_g1_i8.p1 TRINITY_DN5259_c0_g1~~TRINITY_DN5259_c0_g1_i8.p1  ORF type:complete len:303 (-),score=23.64 TRINITY_DN5259_c0_g1_i8:829-1632(-)
MSTSSRSSGYRSPVAIMWHDSKIYVNDMAFLKSTLTAIAAASSCPRSTCCGSRDSLDSSSATHSSPELFDIYDNSRDMGSQADVSLSSLSNGHRVKTVDSDSQTVSLVGPNDDKAPVEHVDAGSQTAGVVLDVAVQSDFEVLTKSDVDILIRDMTAKFEAVLTKQLSTYEDNLKAVSTQGDEIVDTYADICEKYRILQLSIDGDPQLATDRPRKDPCAAYCDSLQTPDKVPDRITCWADEDAPEPIYIDPSAASSSRKSGKKNGKKK